MISVVRFIAAISSMEKFISWIQWYSFYPPLLFLSSSFSWSHSPLLYSSLSCSISLTFHMLCLLSLFCCCCCCCNYAVWSLWPRPLHNEHDSFANRIIGTNDIICDVHLHSTNLHAKIVVRQSLATHVWSQIIFRRCKEKKYSAKCLYQIDWRNPCAMNKNTMTNNSMAAIRYAIPPIPTILYAESTASKSIGMWEKGQHNDNRQEQKGLYDKCTCCRESSEKQIIYRIIYFCLSLVSCPQLSHKSSVNVNM